MSATVENTFLTIDDKEVPIKIYREHRTNVRASIGKKAIILRMPKLMTKPEQFKHLDWFTNWVKAQFQKDNDLHTRFFGKGYQDGDYLTIGGRRYLLRFERLDKKTHNAKLKNGVIHLYLSKHDNEIHLQKAIKHLLSRLIGKDFKSEITRKVNELNQLYFQKDINSVNLKYNQSNWGSCSTAGNVNLSTRLLFAPESVIDYVIIHELAHLIEMNHSARFWKLVADAMPNYKDQEKWLKQNGHLCNF
ncbi:MAG: M48 family metallopeptidase [Saprospiraceae bacterium]